MLRFSLGHHSKTRHPSKQALKKVLCLGPTSPGPKTPGPRHIGAISRRCRWSVHHRFLSAVLFCSHTLSRSWLLAYRLPLVEFTRLHFKSAAGSFVPSIKDLRIQCRKEKAFLDATHVPIRSRAESSETHFQKQSSAAWCCTRCRIR